MSDRLKEIEARWAVTTPGPWRSDTAREYSGHEVWGPKGPGYGTIVTAYPSRPTEARLNAIAIAAAPEDIAWLVAEVGRLRGPAATAEEG